MGEILRLGRTQHDCCRERPASHTFPTGTVWRCSCGNAWVTYVHDGPSGWGGSAWRRKWLPSRRRADRGDRA